MMDATKIEPGQRYATRHPDHISVIAYRGTVPMRLLDTQHPIVEPERLHELKVGATVLNVATGERFEWTDTVRMDWLNAQSSMTDAAPLTPLLALVATPEESNGD